MAGLLDFLMQGQPQGGGLLGNISGYLNNNQDALMALGLGMAGGNTATEGLRGGMQGYLQGRKSDQSRVAGEQFMKDLSGATGGPAPAMPQPAAMPQMAPPQTPGASPIGNYGNAIAGIESAGQANPYAAVGPVTKSGDRAYGKYQVMGANIPVWTKEHVGQEMTPQAFAASPDAQEAVFKGQFGKYVQQTGNPQDAASMWFTGKPLAQGANRADVNGMTGQRYVDKFTAGLGQQPPQASQAPVQVAQAGGGMPAGAQPAPLPGQQTPDALGAIRNMPIGTVLKWAMNPNLAGPQQEVAKEIFKARLEDTKMTEAQKDYMRAKVDGFAGSFADFKNQPSYGNIGTDRFGREQQGFRNPNTLSVTPAQVGGQSGQAPISLVTDLRKEVQAIPSYKNITQAAPVYKSMMDAAGRDNRAADVNMIYGLAKIMDPTSVVRESEMTIAQAVATLPQQLQASIMSQISSTGRLDPATRQAIMGEAHSRISAYKGEFDRDASQYRGIINDYKITPSHVIPDFGEFPQYKSKTAETPPPAGPSRSDLENEMRRRGIMK